MPRYNGMGPNNAGAMTGRGLGPCVGGSCFGRPCNRAGGFGRQPWNMVGLTKAEEKQVLQDEAKNLETEIKDINSRIDEIDK